MKVRKEGK